MKKRVLILLFFIALISSQVFCENLWVLESDSVVINKSGIFALVDGRTISLRSISCSKNGYLVAVETEEVEYYTCPVCGSDVVEGQFCDCCGFPDELKRK